MPFDIPINENLAPIMSYLGTLKESFGWQGFVVLLMLLPIVRMLVYAFISPLGTLFNVLATVFGMLLQALVQIITASALALFQITLSWIQTLNKSALRFSNYVLLFSAVVGGILIHSFFIKQSPSLQVIVIDILCTLLAFALHKLYSVYSSSKRRKQDPPSARIERAQVSQPISAQISAQSKDTEILFGKRLA